MTDLLKSVQDKYPDHIIETRESNMIFFNDEPINFMLPPDILKNVSHSMRLQVNKALYEGICKNIEDIIKGKE
jgi:hypothetical protein